MLQAAVDREAAELAWQLDCLGPPGVASLAWGLQGNTCLTKLCLTGHPVSTQGVEVRRSGGEGGRGGDGGDGAK